MSIKPSLEHAKAIALRFLSYKSRTSQELEKKLREKHVDEETIHEVLRDLKDSELIDDSSYAVEWVDYRSKDKFIGPHRLLKELEMKGVSEEIRDKAVRECFQEMDEKEQAFKAAEKKMRQSEGGNEEKLKRRVCLHLQRKGFSSEAVYSAMGRIFRSNSGSLD